METWDVVVVGGRPAGLTAALILVRCRRRVVAAVAIDRELQAQDHDASRRAQRDAHGPE